MFSHMKEQIVFLHILAKEAHKKRSSRSFLKGSREKKILFANIKLKVVREVAKT